MTSMKVYHYDAFSKEPDKGNPAVAVFDDSDLSEAEMQEIALKVDFNETAFLLRSDVADLRINFLHQAMKCGHATIATVYTLRSKGLLKNKTELTIETNTGVLPIKIKKSLGDEIFITLKQTAPQFKEFTGSKENLLKSIGLKEADLHENLRILYGSTGTWPLLIPIKRLDAFKRMKPNNKQFPEILKEMSKSSIHPCCFETYDSKADMHARHFTSPYSGTIEDAVTGLHPQAIFYND